MSGSPGARGQSEVLGVVLLLGITIIGTGTVVVMGGQALDSTQSATEVESMGLSMTQFDAQAALVALGGSGSQVVDLSAVRNGRITIQPDAGSMTIIHKNYDGKDAGNDRTILPETNLGAVVYENGVTTIAYQAGGVWQSSGRGSVMLSPPEFHYREETLTLPLVTVDAAGSQSASGPVTASIEESGPIQKVYPNTTDNPAFTNPVTNGHIVLKIQSTYYRAWANYFNQQTAANVQTYAENQTTVVSLYTLAATGTMEMPRSGQSVKIRGVKDTTDALDSFNMTVAPTGGNNANFAQLQWGMHAETGTSQFEVFVQTDQGKLCKANNPSDVTATIYYNDKSTDAYEMWTKQFNANSTGGFTVECTDGTPALHMNFTSNTEFTYQAGGETEYFSPSGGLQESTTIERTTYTAGETADVDAVLSRYFYELRPDFELTVSDQNDAVDPSASTLDLQYAHTNQYVTYLHVTENGITISLS